jgi:hypothetical protein
MNNIKEVNITTANDFRTTEMTKYTKFSTLNDINNLSEMPSQDVVHQRGKFVFY